MSLSDNELITAILEIKGGEAFTPNDLYSQDTVPEPSDDMNHEKNDGVVSEKDNCEEDNNCDVYDQDTALSDEESVPPPPPSRTSFVATTTLKRSFSLQGILFWIFYFYCYLSFVMINL